MDYILTMTKVQCISDGEHYLRNLTLILTAMQVIRGIQLSSLTKLHYNIKKCRIIVYLIHFNDIRMFKLSKM